MDDVTALRKKRLRALIDAEYGGEQARIADASGLTPGRISQLLDPVQSFGERAAAMLATKLHLPERYFETRYDTGAVRTNHSNVEPGPDIAGYYPLISRVQAGNWTALADNFQPGDAEEWIASGHNLGSHGYMLRVCGDSMKDPSGAYSFTDGMILHVNADLVPVPGQFVIARRQSTLEATFKRYVMVDGEPYLFALNPDWPREQKYLKLKPGDVWCGVVVTASYKRLP